jgi:hypothetical protein
MGERERLEYYGRPLMEENDLPLHSPATVTERVQDTEQNAPVQIGELSNDLH